MATVLGIQGRFFDISLNPSDIKAASAGQSDRPSIARTIERIWDTIKDWFCRTNVREAKSHLFTLYDPSATDRDKAVAYFALKNLVGGGYVDRFTVEMMPFGYELRIDYGSGIPSFTHSVELCSGDILAEKLNKDISEAWSDPDARCRFQGELVRDLGRAIYMVDGSEIPHMDADRAGDLARLRSLKTAISSRLHASPEQLGALEVITYQKLFAMMIQSSLELHGLPMAYDLLQIRGHGQTTYQMTKIGNDIELYASFSSEWMLGNQEQTTFLQAPAFDTRILVAPDGTAKVISALCGATPNDEAATLR